MTHFSAAPVPASCVDLWQVHLTAKRFAKSAMTQEAKARAEQQVLWTLKNYWDACERETARRMQVLDRHTKKPGAEAGLNREGEGA